VTISLPDPSDLDDAQSRGATRERIAAANNVLGLLAQVRKVMAVNYLGDRFNEGAIDDLVSDVTGVRNKLQEAVDIAMGLEQQRAPRRADPAMVERVRA
jgi:hypothetical protein